MKYPPEIEETKIRTDAHYTTSCTIAPPWAADWLIEQIHTIMINWYDRVGEGHDDPGVVYLPLNQTFPLSNDRDNDTTPAPPPQYINNYM